MAKGTEAKSKVVAKIKEAFGKDYIGESNGKYYIWEMENGEKLQIAISLTCPKTQITEINMGTIGGGLDFSQPAVLSTEPVTTVSEEEQNNIREMMKKLGL